MQPQFQNKIEKISQAVYLVSNHLKDNEPLKWELRKESMAIIGCSRTMEDSSPSDIPADLAIEAVSSSAYTLISLLTLSFVAGLISTGNANLIIRELEDLIGAFAVTYKEYAAKAGFILSDEFFKTIDKGQNPAVSTAQERLPLQPKTAKDKQNSRQNQIIDLLKTQSDLTIKDFARVIVGCSEKTIQRELTELVVKGVVRKDGERRWSKYSLK